MKSLFWTSIPYVKTKDTIWEKIDDTKIEIDLSKFEEKFSQKKKETSSTNQINLESKAKKKEEKKTFLQSDKQRMINIVLNKINLDPLDIVESLEQYDLNILSENICDLILPIMPTEAEINEVKKFNGDPSELANSDQLVLLVSDLVGFKERIKSIIFKNKYKKQINLLNIEADRFYDTFDFIKTDENLKEIFEIILAFGNYMNGGSFRGGAYGFKLDCLKILNEVKSKDNKTTLLQYIIIYINDELQKNKLLDIMKNLENFDNLQFQSIIELNKDLNMKFNDVKNLKNLIEKRKDELNEGDKSFEFLEDFYEDAEKNIEVINKKIEGIEIMYKNEVVKYFAEDEKKISLEQFVNIFKRYHADLKEGSEYYNFYHKKKQKEKTKRKK